MKTDFTFEGFEPANTTPVPDVLFDVLLPKLSGAELKVLLYIMRRTWGFKKNTDAISLTQFEHGIITREGKVLDSGCGLNRETICKALTGLETKGCIKLDKRTGRHRDKDTTLYSIRFKGEVVGKSDQLNQSENPPTLVGKSAYPSRKMSKMVVGKSDLQETVIQETVSQETVQQEDTGASAPPAQFAYQVKGYAAWYHDFCNSAQDRGCNDGLTLLIKPLSDVPLDAICDICYGKMHEPQQYPTAPLSLREEAAELRERTEAALTETGKRRAVSLHDHIDVEATHYRIPAIRMERHDATVDHSNAGVRDASRVVSARAAVDGTHVSGAEMARRMDSVPPQRTAEKSPEVPLNVRGAPDFSVARTDGAATSARSLSPLGNGPRASGAKKQASVPPAGPPQMPPEDATWNTTTCKALFDAWRGVTLIGTYKNSQASTCAKGLVDRYTRAEVEAAKNLMDADKYYIERGGADICDVANNIHKYRKRAKTAAQIIEDDPYSFAAQLARQEA